MFHVEGFPGFVGGGEVGVGVGAGFFDEPAGLKPVNREAELDASSRVGSDLLRVTSSPWIMREP